MPTVVASGECNGPATGAVSSVAAGASTSDLPQAVARMTFSSGKQTHSGFTPEKDISKNRAEPDLSVVNAVKRDLSSFTEADDVSDRKVEVDPVTAETMLAAVMDGDTDDAPLQQFLQTPKKEASSASTSGSASLPRVASR